MFFFPRVSSASAASIGDSAVVLVHDSFTNDSGAGVALVDHAPDTDTLGTGWRETGTNQGTVTQSDYLTVSSDTNNVFYWDPSQFQKIIAEVAYQSTTVYCTVRYVDVNNYWRLFSSPGSETRIIEKTAGGLTVRASMTAPSWTTFWWSDDGNRISLGFDRAPAALAYDSATHNSSRVIGGEKLSFQAWGSFYLMGGTTDPGDLP